MDAVLDRHEVIVIGGGQAGLALGYHLAHQGRRFTILDAGDSPAAVWRSRWDSLTLFTPARHDALPGRAFPGDPDHYPTRDEVVEYLTDYAGDFDLPLELNTRVRAVQAREHGYLVETDDRAYDADQVVIASGPFQTPRSDAALAFADRPMHASAETIAVTPEWERGIQTGMEQGRGTVQRCAEPGISWMPEPNQVRAPPGYGASVTEGRRAVGVGTVLGRCLLASGLPVSRPSSRGPDALATRLRRPQGLAGNS